MKLEKPRKKKMTVDNILISSYNVVNNLSLYFRFFLMNVLTVHTYIYFETLT